MYDLLRETPFGQTVRLLSGNKLFKYPEEEDDFQMPSAIKSDVSGDKETRSEFFPDEREPETGEMVRQNDSPPQGSTSHLADGLFETRRQEQVDRDQSHAINPEKMSDSITLVDWYTPDDPANPQNWSFWKKVLVDLQIILYTFVVYCGSAIYTSSERGVMERYGVGQSKASLGLSLYVIGYGVGPLLFSPLSEVPMFGRNLPYITTFAIFVILSVPTALVDNYSGLMALRFFGGFMGSPCLATGGATMQDMYSFLKLPYALTAWVAAAFTGPALGPLLSGFAVPAKGWRWSLWEIVWMSGPVFILMFLTLPETSSANILLRRARRLRARTGNERFRSQSEIDQGNKTIKAVITDSLIKPAQIFIQDPAVFFVNVYTSLIYGIYYSFFAAFPLVYIDLYGFNLGEMGLVFLCIAVACVIGVTIYCSYVYLYLEPDIIAHGLRAQEHRLVPALFAVFALPVGLFIFAWTARSDIHWIVSVIGITINCVGAFVLFQCIFMYLPLTYPQYAASLFAANDFCRSALAAGSIIFAYPLYVNLGIGRGVTILGGLSAGGVAGIWALYLFGAKLRARSKFAKS